MKAVEDYGLPSRLKCDEGKENVLVADYMLDKRGTGKRRVITARSTQKESVEGLWKDVFSGVLSYFYHLFYFIEDEGILDLLNDSYLAVLHYVYLPQINSKLEW